MIIETENKREQILQSAAIFFGKYGFSKTTLDDIAGYMGMKKNSLYYYFPSKEALFEEVIKSHTTRIFENINTVIESKNTASEKLKACFEAGRIIERKENFHDFSIHSIIDIHNTIRDSYVHFHGQCINLFRNIIQEGIDKGEFRTCNAEETAKSILHLVESIKLRKFHESKAVKYLSEIDFTETEKTISTLLDLISEGLKVK